MTATAMPMSRQVRRAVLPAYGCSADAPGRYSTSTTVLITTIDGTTEVVTTVDATIKVVSASAMMALRTAPTLGPLAGPTARRCPARGHR